METSEGESPRLQVFHGDEKTVYLTVDCPNCNADNRIQHDMTNSDFNEGSALYKCTNCGEEFYLHATCVVRWEATRIWKR